MADIALSNGFRPSPAARRPLLTLPQQPARLAPDRQGAPAIVPPGNNISPDRNRSSGNTISPGASFTASGLPDRARSLMVLLDSIGRATKVIEAAEGGLKALTVLVETARNTARQALQSPSATPKVTGANNLALSETTLLHAASAGGFVAGDTITVNGTPVLTFTAGDGVDDLLHSINSDSLLNPPGGARKVQAALNARGQIVVEALDGAGLAISGSAPDKVSILFGKAALNAAENLSPERSVLAAEFDVLRRRIDRRAAESGYGGTNLLDGSPLKVQFNEEDTASLSVSGIRFDAAGLGIPAATNRWQSDTDIRDSIDALEAGLTRLGDQALALATNLSTVQTRQDFTAGMAGRLEADPERLPHADEGEEAARLIMLQTRHQLAATALGLATQSEQSVLRLF